MSGVMCDGQTKVRGNSYHMVVEQLVCYGDIPMVLWSLVYLR